MGLCPPPLSRTSRLLTRLYKIAAGLTEALEIARGNAKATKLYVPAEISVRGIRKKLELSQDDFAQENARADAACRRAILIKARSVASIRSILKSGLDRAFLDETSDHQPLRHGNIRGQGYFH